MAKKKRNPDTTTTATTTPAQRNALAGLKSQLKGKDSGGKTTKSEAAGTDDFAWMQNADHSPEDWMGAWAWINGTEEQLNATRFFRSDHGNYYAEGSRAEGYDKRTIKNYGGTDYDPKSPELHRFKIGASSGSTRSAAAVLEIFIKQAKKNPEQFARIQAILQRAGYYPDGSPPLLGVYGAADQAAMLQALQDAHSVKMPFKDYLLNRAAHADALGPTLRRVPPVISLTNPVTIRAAFNATDSTGSSLAGHAIGHNLDDQQLQRYIDEVHAGERASQIAADNANPTYEKVDAQGNIVGAAGPTPGGDVVKPPELSGDVLQQYLKRDHPDEFQATQMGERASDLLALMTRRLPGAESVGQ
jgi:peptidoglycan hydrolase-like protein with peptidoglycan-binding domain